METRKVLHCSWSTTGNVHSTYHCRVLVFRLNYISSRDNVEKKSYLVTSDYLYYYHHLLKYKEECHKRDKVIKCLNDIADTTDYVFI